MGKDPNKLTRDEKKKLDSGECPDCGGRVEEAQRLGDIYTTNCAQCGHGFLVGPLVKIS